MINNDMTLNEVLKAAREQLQATPVPEQDLAVARAHMLAAHARAQAAGALLPQLTKAPVQHQFAGRLAQAGASADGNNRFLPGLPGSFSKWLLSLVILILAGIWLSSPVTISANDDSLAGVSASGGSDFMPLVDSATWSNTKHAFVVPTQLAVTELAALGLPFDASRAADMVHAELLMSDSGELIGVRLLSQHETPRSSSADIELS